MKILVVQLARLGDIYMTWPVMKSLRRTYPQAEIHLLTRSRFQSATEGLEAVDQVHTLNVAGILEPVLLEDNLEGSLNFLKKKIHSLRSLQFDQIINLTFSPASSYITSALTSATTEVKGYSRYSDGTLKICDEYSGFFYSHVGTQSYNRVHLTDLFAAVAGVEYVGEDWSGPQVEAPPQVLPAQYAVLHVGASEQHKSLPIPYLVEAIESYLELRPEGAIVLIGSKEEQAFAEQVIAQAGDTRIQNLVGQTKLVDVFALLQEAEILIGADSAPIHMAALTDTKTLNISTGVVNFYETGPKAGYAGVLRGDVAVGQIRQSLGCLLGASQERPSNLYLRSFESIESFECDGQNAFQWGLLKALYLGQDFPMAEKIEIIKGAIELQNINNFAMEQIALIPEKGLQLIGPLLDSADDVIQKISRLVPELSPMVGWYNAEKVRIGPGTLEEICAATLQAHARLARYLEAYIPTEALMDREDVLDGTL